MKSGERRSTVDVETIAAPGRHADGHNLYLKVSKTGQKSWVFMWRSDSRQPIHWLVLFLSRWHRRKRREKD